MNYGERAQIDILFFASTTERAEQLQEFNEHRE